jgi:hypothetical protein
LPKCAGHIRCASEKKGSTCSSRSSFSFCFFLFSLLAFLVSPGQLMVLKTVPLCGHRFGQKGSVTALFAVVVFTTRFLSAARFLFAGKIARYLSAGSLAVVVFIYAGSLAFSLRARSSCRPEFALCLSMVARLVSAGSLALSLQARSPCLCTLARCLCTLARIVSAGSLVLSLQARPSCLRRLALCFCKLARLVSAGSLALSLQARSVGESDRWRER